MQAAARWHCRGLCNCLYWRLSYPLQRQSAAHFAGLTTLMNTIRHIIAVASGKGGVGKSTTAVNLALALQALGARTGLLDADIYGPSQQRMLGIDDGVKPEQQGGQFLLPVMAHGLKTMSMAYLSSERTPMVWRGPMAGSALVQMLEQTLWGELDYLVIDMPPGTGDIQLTLSQKATVAGAVIVTTPQDIALLDARKGIEMFRKVDVPILGIVENMAVHICSQCGHAEHIFGTAGGEQVARDYGVPLLASLPLALSIREQTDAGTPTVAVAPESPEAALYMQAARAIQAALEQHDSGAVREFPEITISDD
ncbi:iron-sulfur cluster carrier protein ApbC [Kineobactrum sediminis]|uniref:iron-sulfur cluster carrier protein ApbC n=1 Tax=Kineobactrum sediminis TaxID=1905677 RepID=UPI00240904E2|nr:iron-sulfur cluster carrier protein ApbC [Kineobactrum sediminis]